MEQIYKAVEAGKCIGCGNCLSICPVSAISTEVRNGFQYPSVNQNACVRCGKCDGVCPVNGEEVPLVAPIGFYAAYANETTMCTESTSGGLCTLATEYIIQNGGVAYSVRFTDDWDVEYARLDDLNNMKAHVGSKYMQAKSNNVQKQIKSDIQIGRNVLLIGTPCFVGAVKKYLDKGRIDSRNLITIDFLCHGVPSAEIGKTFIKELEHRSKKKLEAYNFRSKGFGWGKLARSLKFEGESEKCIRADFCPLHTWFGQHLSLRESCFKCDYRRIERPSDITVADFWKIEKYYPEIPMQQGISSVQINTKHGNDFYKMLIQTGNVVSYSVSKASIWEHRRTATKNFEKPGRYDEFWTTWKNQGLKGINKMVPAQTVLGLVIGKLKSLLRSYRRIFK